jgi:hypothetical protein
MEREGVTRIAFRNTLELSSGGYFDTHVPIFTRVWPGDVHLEPTHQFLGSSQGRSSLIQTATNAVSFASVDVSVNDFNAGFGTVPFSATALVLLVSAAAAAVCVSSHYDQSWFLLCVSSRDEKGMNLPRRCPCGKIEAV